MNCIVPIEGRFLLNQDRPASPHLTYDRFWKRYLSVFDSVTVIGRVFKENVPDLAPVEGPGVSFVALPGYSGPTQFWLNYPQIQIQLNQVDFAHSAVILRIPGAVGNTVWQRLNRSNHPYGVEVVGDPHDVFAPGATRHPLRPLFRWWFSRQLRKQCAEAGAAAYVTAYALQQRYPAAAHAVSTSYSSVELSGEGAFAPKGRIYQPFVGHSCRLVSVGNMAQMYKGHDILIKSLAICVARGLDLTLTLVGEGRYRSELAGLVQHEGLANRVEFTGSLSAGAPIQDRLDHADIFVLASRVEGLPRAVIEAMARGLPCIATNVGGIPELLQSDCLVPPNDEVSLAEKITQFVSDPDLLTAQSARNLGRAQGYAPHVLRGRREQFYQQVKDLTQSWLHSKKLST
jgi:glycosyltransferase involved in cell wall biosynthesis